MATGDAEHNAEHDDGFPVRVVTWNIWRRHGPWQEREPAVLATLRDLDADIVTLQEVWSTPGGDDQAAWLARELGREVASVSVETSEGDRVGNAILSRWPLQRAVRHQIAAEDKGNRWALLVSVNSPAGPVTVVTVHLEARHYQSAQRQEQVAAAARFIAAETRVQTDPAIPPLLTGDLNAEPQSDEVRMLLGLTAVPVPNLVFADAWTAAGDGPGLTWSQANPYVAAGPWPSRRIDYVLYGQPPQGPDLPPERPHFRPVRCWLVGVDPVDGVQPSDHYGVAADFRVRHGVERTEQAARRA